MIIAALITGIIVVCMIMAPFFWGKGGMLVASSSIQSIPLLENLKHLILQRFLDDEKAFEQHKISKRSWLQRKQYLINRYVDVTRRLDYLRSLGQSKP